MKKKLLQGIDRLDFSILSSKKVALITNHTAVNKNGTSTVELLLANNVLITMIFSLEHGYFPVAQDMETVGHEMRLFNIPLISLYGYDQKSLEPDSRLFEHFDTVIYDIQDIGSRYYTYLQSLTIFMDYLEKSPKQLIILDRINPINGVDFEGVMLEEQYASFVGRFSLLNRHGLTSGELANYYYSLRKYTFPIEVVKVDGWVRDSFFDDYDYPWIPTSPNMPTVDTALIYPGACLLEGTNMSEGRGTTFPFLVAGKRGFNPFTVKEKFDALEIAGLTFMPLEFRPMFQKEEMERCGGVYIHINDRKKLKPFRAFLKILQTLREIDNSRWFFRAKPYEFIENIPAIELLLGCEALVDLFYQKADFVKIEELLCEHEEKYANLIKEFLLY